MKGIVLAGGSGTRLYPLTMAVSKQLMPIYDKPMIYYPISVLLQAGISEILIITTPEDNLLFKKLLGDGRQIGCSFSYAIQEKPRGLAEAFIVGEDFLAGDSVCLILGDNIFYGNQLKDILTHSTLDGGIIFAYQVANPNRYGVVNIDKKGIPISIEEKPERPQTNLAVPGIYFFDKQAPSIAKKVKPSARGEIEITSVIQHYLDEKKLRVIRMNKEIAWLDTGTFDSLSDASEFVRVIEKRQGTKIGCIEEEAFRAGFINKDQLQDIAQRFAKSGYGEYLLSVAKE